MDEREAVKRMVRGHRLAAERQKLLVRQEGPDPDAAFAGAMSMLDMLEDMGHELGARDIVTEREVEEVRKRWARIQKRSRALATRSSHARQAGARRS